jgi:hypothetical protein
VVPTLYLLVGVQQVTKEGAPAGLMALQHEADVQVTVDTMQWSLKKSRYQDIAGASGDVLPVRNSSLRPIESETSNAAT